MADNEEVNLNKVDKVDKADKADMVDLIPSTQQCR